MKRLLRAPVSKLGEALAVLVWSFAEDGHVKEAAWIERKWLNPVQRFLGADVSSYAEKAKVDA